MFKLEYLNDHGDWIRKSWRIGHKDILEFMGRQFKVFSWQTVRRWKRKGMPFHRLWNDRPYIIEDEVIRWQRLEVR